MATPSIQETFQLRLEQRMKTHLAVAFPELERGGVEMLADELLGHAGNGRLVDACYSEADPNKQNNLVKAEMIRQLCLKVGEQETLNPDSLEMIFNAAHARILASEMRIVVDASEINRLGAEVRSDIDTVYQQQVAGQSIG